MSSDATDIQMFSSPAARQSSAEVVDFGARQREAHCREIIEALPAAIYTTDAAGRITFYNEAAVSLSGRRPVLGSDQWCVSWKLFNADGTPLPHDECPMAVALRENRPIRGVEAIAERPDGSRVPFMPFPTPIRDSSGALIGAINMLVDITERKTIEERVMLLAREVDHRANNLLAVVQATVRLSHADTVQELKATIDGRVRALARAHTLLSRSQWVGADLRALISEELATFGGENGRVTIEGPEVILAAAAAQSMAMALHELATNAVRHGALSTEGGRVSITWRLAPDGRATLHWSETGGPRVTPPDRRGFGSMVIESAILRDMRGEVTLDWRPEGLVCEIVGRATQV